MAGVTEATGTVLRAGTLDNRCTGMLRELTISAVVLGSEKRCRTVLSLYVVYPSRPSNNDSSHLAPGASRRQILGR